MCLLCEDQPLIGHAIAVAERPSAVLFGHWWRGAGTDSAAGEMNVLARVHERAEEIEGMWRSPVTALTIPSADGTLEFFAGFAVDDADARPHGLESFQLEAMRCATIAHKSGRESVLSSYGFLLEWIRAHGLVRADARIGQREEYPPGTDPYRPELVRLMIPLA